MNGEVRAMVYVVLPEIILVVLGGLVLALDLYWRDSRCRKLGWFSAGGLFLAAVVSLVFGLPENTPQFIWGGMLRLDWISYLFRAVFLVGGAITAMIAMESPALYDRGEFYLLLLVSTMGMGLMAASADLIMLYLAIETTSIPLYILAGFRIQDQKSVESGIKYILFGAMTSAVMLYGFSLLYGFTGTTNLYEIASRLQAGQVPPPIILIILGLVLVGFGFKISAVPFHFWAPDVYEGSPTPVAGFISTASKAAGFVVLLRVLFSIFSGYTQVWSSLIIVLAILSMTLGNLLALAQKNIKRLLAYSSIAQAGYILVGVAASSNLGSSGASYYLVAYLFTNLAAFGIVSAINRSLGSDEISAYAGLSRRSPGLALALLVSLLSLGGIPPFAGFIGKVLVFGAAVEANLWWLALIGVLNSVIGLYYYLVVLKAVYLLRSEDETRPLSVPAPRMTAILICITGVLILGIFVSPLFDLTTRVASAFLGY